MNQLSLYPLFQSGMVLQRNKPITIWGNAPQNSIVTVTLNLFAAASKAHEDGTFRITLPAMKEAFNCCLSVSCNVEGILPILLHDVAIGDVWLAGGQSNMEFFLRYDKDWDTVKHWENNPSIRVYNVPQVAFEGHKSRSTQGYGRWMQSEDPDFETFSAPAYSFARHLQPQLQVPIGIIGCNWGGTTAAAWLDEDELKEAPLSVYLQEYQKACALFSKEDMQRLSMEGWAFEDSKEHDLEFRPLLYGRDYAWQKEYMSTHQGQPVIPMGPYNINRPGGLYHTMLQPLTSFAIKGVIWYQGESDAGHADIYDVLMHKLITFWRQQWNDELPFLFVQLAPFGVWLECTSENYAIVRKQQEKVSDTVPGTGMVSIMDIGSYYDIHPKEKMEVGRRLALLARGKVYGEDILCQSPRFASGYHSKDTIVLQFINCTSLSINEGVTDWTITQDSQPVELRSITANGSTLTLKTSPLTDSAINVALGDADYAQIHIYNEAKLPVCPFQTVITETT